MSVATFEEMAERIVGPHLNGCPAWDPNLRCACEDERESTVKSWVQLLQRWTGERETLLTEALIETNKTLRAVKGVVGAAAASAGDNAKLRLARTKVYEKVEKAVKLTEALLAR